VTRSSRMSTPADVTRFELRHLQGQLDALRDQVRDLAVPQPQLEGQP